MCVGLCHPAGQNANESAPVHPQCKLCEATGAVTNMLLLLLLFFIDVLRLFSDAAIFKLGGLTNIYTYEHTLSSRWCERVNVSVKQCKGVSAPHAFVLHCFYFAYVFFAYFYIFTSNVMFPYTEDDWNKR